MRVAVVGQGYVGLTISMGAVSAGHSVVGLDLSKELIKNLAAGKSHIEGIEDETLEAALHSGRYFPSSTYEALGDVEVVVIAVPTPLKKSGEPDLAILESASTQLGGALKSRTLVINESTSHPGTLRDLIRPLVEAKSPLNHLYAISPERVDPGNEKYGTKNTPRVVGGLTDEARDLAVKFYKTFCDEVLPVSSAEVAEAAKLLENTFRFINIGLVNEFVQLMNAMGIPGNEVISAASSKPYGFMPFHPNVGIGGHCIPVDPMYLQAKANALGLESRYITLSESINREMPNYVIERLVKHYGDVKGKKIQVIGVSYKADVADTRETPAEAVIQILRELGAIVNWHDPLVSNWNSESSSSVDPYADIAIVLVAHKKLDLSRFTGPIYTLNPKPGFANWIPLLSSH